MENQEQKTRHGFVTFWLWLMILCNFAVGAVGLLSIGDNVNQGLSGFLSYASLIIGCMSIVNAVAALLLLEWKKIGFWIFIATATISLCVMIASGCIGGWADGIGKSIAGAIAGPVILYLILQIKKDGKSCWNQLH